MPKKPINNSSDIKNDEIKKAENFIKQAENNPEKALKNLNNIKTKEELPISIKMTLGYRVLNKLFEDSMVTSYHKNSLAIAENGVLHKVDVNKDGNFDDGIAKIVCDRFGLDKNDPKMLSNIAYGLFDAYNNQPSEGLDENSRYIYLAKNEVAIKRFEKMPYISDLTKVENQKYIPQNIKNSIVYNTFKNKIGEEFMGISNDSLVIINKDGSLYDIKIKDIVDDK